MATLETRISDLEKKAGLAQVGGSNESALSESTRMAPKA
jgi:hypothetical protein